jgi:hypothetical protein
VRSRAPASALVRASSARSSRKAACATPLVPRKYAPIATLSSTVMPGMSFTCWNVRPMPSCAISYGGRLPMLVPFSKTSPT